MIARMNFRIFTISPHVWIFHANSHHRNCHFQKIGEIHKGSKIHPWYYCYDFPQKCQFRLKMKKKWNFSEFSLVMNQNVHDLLHIITLIEFTGKNRLPDLFNRTCLYQLRIFKLTFFHHVLHESFAENSFSEFSWLERMAPTDLKSVNWLNFTNCSIVEFISEFQLLVCVAIFFNFYIIMPYITYSLI